MTDPIIDRLDQIKGRADKAADHVGKIAAREHRWTMSVPPRETDTDILLTQCLDTDVPQMEQALRAVLVTLDEWLHAGQCTDDLPCFDCALHAELHKAIATALGVETEGEES